MLLPRPAVRTRPQPLHNLPRITIIIPQNTWAFILAYSSCRASNRLCTSPRQTLRGDLCSRAPCGASTSEIPTPLSFLPCPSSSTSYCSALESFLSPCPLDPCLRNLLLQEPSKTPTGSSGDGNRTQACRHLRLPRNHFTSLWHKCF